MIACFLIVSFSSAFAFSRIKKTAFSTKQEELSSAAEDISSLLSLQGVSSIPEIVSPYTEPYRRIIVTDASLNILYDSSYIENSVGKMIILPAMVTALKGNNYFNAGYADPDFEACFSTPFFSDNKISGVVSIFESDISMQRVFSVYKSAMLITALFIFCIMLSLSALISSILSHRISNLLTSVKATSKDDIMKEIPISYNDEIAPIVSEFNKIYEKLAYVQQMRQAFVSDASHELRTPLTAIRLLCESITQTESIDADTVREFMDDIVLEVDRMSHTAEKLLVLSKLDNATSPLLAPVSLTDAVHNSIAALEPIAADKSVTIESYIEEYCTISADPEGVKQIVSNLIDNAIKYNNEGGVLRIFLFTKKNKCVFITDDTGIGISPEFREQIFERFYRIDKSRKHDGRGGSGLGLAIVKRNIEAFGGTISVSDSVHGGTRFTVTFPTLLSEEEERI